VSAGDLAAVIVSVVVIGAIVAIAVATSALLRTLRELRATLEVVRGEVVPLVGELRDTVSAAGGQVDRVDDLLDTAEAISATVEGASRVGYLAFRAPLIRAVALGRGVRRGAGRLVGRRPEPTTERPVPRPTTRREPRSRSRAA
jgi:hypothetical protein